MTPFVCPLCAGPLFRDGGSLRCDRRHAFDVARQGYVNLLRKPTETLYEDRALFAARRVAFAAGFFAPLCEAIRALLPDCTVLDAGCGEGSMLAALLGADIARGVGLDISREAVRMAAATYKGAAWCVADLCAIPLLDASVGAVVNVLTPANYAEFARVLAPGGLLIKAVPGGAHLCEVRAFSGVAPDGKPGGEAAELFPKRFSAVERVDVRYSTPCDAALFSAIYRMTPLTARTAMPENRDAPDAVTVDIRILVGKKQ